MKLQPRHFVLLAVILALFGWNIFRAHQRHQQELKSFQQSNSAAASAWSAYDHASALRDAPDDQFQPAFTALRSATEGDVADQNAQALTAVRSCKTWLVFYRNPQWRSNARKHVDGCTKFHLDTISE